MTTSRQNNIMLVNMFDNNDQKMGCLFYWCLGNLYAWDTIFGDFKGLFDKKLIFPARMKLKKISRY